MARLALVVGLVAYGAVFWFDVQRVTTLGMDVAPPVWVIDAIPPVLSGQLFGHQVRYTSLASVRDQFERGLDSRSRKADDVDAVMTEIARLNPASIGRQYRLLGPDDKG